MRTRQAESTSVRDQAQPDQTGQAEELTVHQEFHHLLPNGPTALLQTIPCGELDHADGPREEIRVRLFFPVAEHDPQVDEPLLRGVSPQNVHVEPLLFLFLLLQDRGENAGQVHPTEDQHAQAQGIPEDVAVHRLRPDPRRVRGTEGRHKGLLAAGHDEEG